MSCSKLPSREVTPKGGLGLHDQGSSLGDPEASSVIDSGFDGLESPPDYANSVREVNISQEDFHAHAKLLGKTLALKLTSKI